MYYKVLVCGVCCIGEAVNYSAGLGFSGYDDRGRSRWTLLDNAEVYYVEVAKYFCIFSP